MNQQIRQALAQDQTIDITTTGRETGQPRRLEIWFHNLDGAFYITGTPGKRSWYANLLAHPDFTFHLKQSAVADLPARATPVTDPAERRALFKRILTNIGRTEDPETWVADSPLVKVTFPDKAMDGSQP
jgi:deazaflavin-dependent oxidoreductase (nitroreductase family)